MERDNSKFCLCLLTSFFSICNLRIPQASKTFFITQSVLLFLENLLLSTHVDGLITLSGAIVEHITEAGSKRKLHCPGLSDCFKNPIAPKQGQSGLILVFVCLFRTLLGKSLFLTAWLLS